MKRFLPLFTAALMLPIFSSAQTPSPKPAVKAGTKANIKPATPAAVEPVAPKTPLLTREELRACKGQVEANDAEAKTINVAQAVFNAERDELKKIDDELRQIIKDRNASAAAMTQERAELLKAGEDLEAKVKEAKKEEGATLVATHNAKAAAFTARADDFNQVGAALKTQAAAHGGRVDKYNQGKNELVARADAYNRSIASWKANCADRRYDEADDLAIKSGK